MSYKKKTHCATLVKVDGICRCHTGKCLMKPGWFTKTRALIAKSCNDICILSVRDYWDRCIQASPCHNDIDTGVGIFISTSAHPCFDCHVSVLDRSFFPFLWDYFFCPFPIVLQHDSFETMIPFFGHNGSSFFWALSPLGPQTWKCRPNDPHHL